MQSEAIGFGYEIIYEILKCSMRNSATAIEQIDLGDHRSSLSTQPLTIRIAFAGSIKVCWKFAESSFEKKMNECSLLEQLEGIVGTYEFHSLESTREVIHKLPEIRLGSTYELEYHINMNFNFMNSKAWWRAFVQWFPKSPIQPKSHQFAG